MPQKWVLEFHAEILVCHNDSFSGTWLSGSKNVDLCSKPIRPNQQRNVVFKAVHYIHKTLQKEKVDSEACLTFLKPKNYLSNSKNQNFWANNHVGNL